MFGFDLGIDLGTSSLVIAMPGKGIVLNEPSYIAYVEDSEKMLYAGKRAYFLQGREPQGVRVAQPMKDGVIGSYKLTEKMLSFFLGKVIGKTIFRPRVVACVPSVTTDVEKRTIVSVLINAGARSVCLIEEPLAAAFGSNTDPLQPGGIFVIDVGGGTTDLAVVSGGSMAQTETIKIAGTDFDEEIVKYMRSRFGMNIGIRMAEDIKKNVGCAVPRPERVVMTAKGSDVKTGLPREEEVNDLDIYDCLFPMLETIREKAVAMFERTSPQLVADISRTGVILAGGGALMYGMDKMFAEALGVEARVADDPQECVAKGTAVALTKMNVLDGYGYRFKTKEDVRIR